MGALVGTDEAGPGPRDEPWAVPPATSQRRADLVQAVPTLATHSVCDLDGNCLGPHRRLTTWPCTAYRLRRWARTTLRCDACGRLVAHEASCPLGAWVPCLTCGGIDDHDPCCERQMDRSDVAALLWCLGIAAVAAPLIVLLVYLPGR